MPSDADYLHPDATRFLEMLARPGVPEFHELSTEQQRTASEKMMFAFRPPPPGEGSATEAKIPRSAAEGGPLRFRHYRPPEAEGKLLPTLLWLHGGGWTVGNIESYDVLCRQLANAADCAVLSLAYRLAPEHPFPAAVDDAWLALRWLIRHGREHGIDPTRLAVGGDSAGGNLAIVTALQARDAGMDNLRLQLLVYPATDQRGITASHRRYGQGYLLTQTSIRMFQHGYLRREEDYTDWRASPLLAPSLAGLPPALVIAASHDPLVDDCRDFAARLLDEDVAAEWVEYSGTIHGFFALGKAFPSAAPQAVTRAASRLRAAFG